MLHLQFMYKKFCMIFRKRVEKKKNTLNNIIFIINQSNNIEISSQFNNNPYLYFNTKKLNKCLKRIKLYLIKLTMKLQ